MARGMPERLERRSLRKLRPQPKIHRGRRRERGENARENNLAKMTLDKILSIGRSALHGANGRMEEAEFVCRPNPVVNYAPVGSFPPTDFPRDDTLNRPFSAFFREGFCGLSPGFRLLRICYRSRWPKHCGCIQVRSRRACG